MPESKLDRQGSAGANVAQSSPSSARRTTEIKLASGEEPLESIRSTPGSWDAVDLATQPKVADENTVISDIPKGQRTPNANQQAPTDRQDVRDQGTLNDRNGGPNRLQARQSNEACFNADPLTLDGVLSSVAESYPLLEVALHELAAAEGYALASWGSFDTVLSGYSISKPIGFYENHQNGVKVSRPMWSGGELYGGYRIGRGEFEPWYLERETNKGGEFKTGVKLPFLKGYAIDGRRAAVQTAELERSRLEPEILMRVIAMQLSASQQYWKWVATGKMVRTQQSLLSLARKRNEGLAKQVQEGDVPKITEVDNERFITQRQTKLIEARRKVQESAIKLSLFYRDSAGVPIVVADDRLPCDFPKSSPPDLDKVESDIAAALSQRPEIRDLDFQRQQVQVELCYAENQTLPKLDTYAEAGQDVGEPASVKNDKSEFEVELGVLADVPLQRRAAVGKIQASRSKLAQISAKRRFVEDKIRSQVLDAVSALNNAFERIERARENLRLTEQSLRLGRRRFEEGDIDIIELNIYETSLADAELALIDAEFTYFVALAAYRAALGVVPGLFGAAS